MYLQITTMQLEREKALEHKNRMSRMLEDRDLFVMRLKAARQSVYEVKLTDFWGTFIHELFSFALRFFFNTVVYSVLTFCRDHSNSILVERFLKI